MKKVFIMLAAVAAFTITSCKNESKQTDAAAEKAGESIEELAAQSDVSDPTQLGDDLSKALESNDGEGIKGKIDAAKEYAQNLLKEGKGEQAKGIIEKIQSFLSENAEKVTSVVGDNSFVQGALDWVKGVDAGDLINKAGEALGVENAAGAAEAAKDAAADKVAGAVEAVKGTAAEKAGAAVDAVKGAAEEMKDKATEMKDAAVEKGNEAIQNAKEAVKEQVVDKAKETVNDAVNKGVEAVGNLLK